MAEGKRLERGFSSSPNRRSACSDCDIAWIRNSCACLCCYFRLAPLGSLLTPHRRRTAPTPEVGSARSTPPCTLQGRVSATIAVYQKLATAALASSPPSSLLGTPAPPHAERSSAIQHLATAELGGIQQQRIPASRTVQPASRLACAKVDGAGRRTREKAPPLCAVVVVRHRPDISLLVQ